MTDDAISRAALQLRDGQLVVIPTETVYGLAANAENDRAVTRIFEAKGRPSFNPLIVHVPNVAMAEHYGIFNAEAHLMADHFWPGPLTLVVKRRPDSPVSHLATAGLDTVALRMPRHPVAQALLARLEFGLAAPSANRSGRISPTTADHARDELGDQAAAVLEGGPCEIGLESTVCAVMENGVTLLRLGSVTREMIEAKTGLKLSLFSGHDDHAPRAPGMLLKHYAPRLKLRINVTKAEEGEALLAFGPKPLPGAKAMLNLSERGDLSEAAANLFAHLRALDREEFTGIAVMPVPENGIGAAINDRLRRACER